MNVRLVENVPYYGNIEAVGADYETDLISFPDGPDFWQDSDEFLAKKFFESPKEWCFFKLLKISKQEALGPYRYARVIAIEKQMRKEKEEFLNAKVMSQYIAESIKKRKIDELEKAKKLLEKNGFAVNYVWE